MPHTSHKKKAIHKKRKEVVDDEGWTRVTSSTDLALGVTQRPAAGDSDTSLPRSAGAQTDANPSETVARPMQPVRGTTVETMTAQYRKIETKWRESDMCRVLQDILRQSIAGGRQEISHCVVFGSGSFCGDEIHWIDRHESAYYQIAAFKVVADTVEQIQGRRPPCYAQEPYYNDLDAAFLATLDVTRVGHPQGFELLDGNSFVYSPAAEPEVELQIIRHNPKIWLHRSLEPMLQSNERISVHHEDDINTKHDLAESFRKTHESAQLPAMDLKNYPFHGSVLWWRKNSHENKTEP